MAHPFKKFTPSADLLLPPQVGASQGSTQDDGSPDDGTSHDDEDDVDADGFSDADELEYVTFTPFNFTPGPDGVMSLDLRMPEALQWRRYVRCIDGEWQIMALRAKTFGDSKPYAYVSPMVVDSVENVVSSLPGSTEWAAVFLGLDAPARGWDGTESLWSYAKCLDVPVTRVMWLLRMEQELRTHFVDGMGKDPVSVLVEHSGEWKRGARVDTGAAISTASLLPRAVPTQESISGLSDAALESALYKVGIDDPREALQSRLRHGFSCFAWVERSIETRLRGRDVLTLREPTPAERDLAGLAAVELFARLSAKEGGKKKSAENILCQWHESISFDLMTGEPYETITALVASMKLLFPLHESVGYQSPIGELGKMLDLPFDLTDYVSSFVSAAAEALPQVPPVCREVIMDFAAAMEECTDDAHERLLLRGLLAFHGWGLGDRKARGRLERLASRNPDEPLLAMMHIDALTIFDSDAEGHREAAEIAGRLAREMHADGIDATEWFARAAAYEHIAEELAEAEPEHGRKGTIKARAKRARKAALAAQRGEFVPPTMPSTFSGVLPGGVMPGGMMPDGVMPDGVMPELEDLSDHPAMALPNTRNKLRLVS